VAEPPPSTPPARSRWDAGRIVLLVLGSLATLFALVLLAAAGVGFWAYTQKDDDGFFRTGAHNFSTPSFALESDDLDIGNDAPDWLFDEGRLATLRIEASSTRSKPVFLGIGPKDAVDAYLRGVGHAIVTDVDFDPFGFTAQPRRGGPPPTPPQQQSFWAVSDSGSDPAISWNLAKGNWAAVVMNEDGSRIVAADVTFGARVGWLIWVALGVLIAGLLVLAAGVAMIVFGARGGPATETSRTTPPLPVPAGEYPLALEGELDADLSRWLWIVKWLLAIPHYIVLAFLWLAFVVLTVVAFFAILFTGRYPRGIFDFNVGVLRWTWRVGFYSYSALGTDRYPPFSLGPEPDYPARLEIPYPEQLSRGLALVKWWLLAIPHYLVLMFLVGGGFWWDWRWGWGYGWIGWGGLNGILVLCAAIYLLFTGRYYRDIFVLVIGINRWLFRVVAYASLMRDEYPPFRLR
jgi:Domain of unknown function (DUF4389)